MQDLVDKPAVQPTPTRTLKADITKNLLEGNKPLTVAGVKKLARLGSKRAMERIVLGIESTNEFVAVKCAEKTLDRAFGKAEQNLAIKGELTHGVTSELLSLARQLHQEGLIKTAPQIADQADVQDAEFVEVTGPEGKVGDAG